MPGEKTKADRLGHTVRIAKAVTTLAVVAVPIIVTVGVVAGYGAYSLVRHLLKTK